MTLIFPGPSLAHEPHEVYQAKEDRNLNKWSHGGRQGLVAICSKGGNGNGNSQLKVVARRSEALCDREGILETKSVGNEDGGAEDGDEIDNKRGSNAHHGHDLVDQLAPLGREENDDGV